MDERVYLVTGAAGFLGGTVVRRLVEEGKRVRAFVLAGDPAIKYIPQEAEVVEGDLTDIDSLEPLFAVEEDTHTVMLHIASFVSGSSPLGTPLAERFLRRFIGEEGEVHGRVLPLRDPGH